jgi:tetratricopeptide (TPR) repeat protein
MRLTSLLLLLIVFLPLSAQRKQIGEARDILKSGRNVERAEQLMTGLLKDSANRDNKRIYQLWLQSVTKQYEAANERLYLKQKQDTAAFFNLVKRMFDIAQTLDTIDAKPDKKGRSSTEYRKDNAERLLTYRPNLFNGGTYFLTKGQYQQAFRFFEHFMDCARLPLFSESHIDSTDHRMSEAAYWATYCGYKLQDPLLTLRHRQLALKDTTKTEFTLQYMAEARLWLKDDSLYMETLREGFRLYPQDTYFFPRLMDYYTQRGDHKAALDVVDTAIERCSVCELYLYAKATTLFNLKRYDECIALSDSLIARNDTVPEAYYNAATAYLNKALKLDPLKEKKQLRRVYQKARPYMERYRQLAPDQKDKWGPALYRIYFNLNLGRQFDEIDRLLR